MEDHEAARTYREWYLQGRLLIERYVLPYYLQMMRCNAVQDGERLAPEIAGIASEASTEDLLRLLGAFWRERVMGAWLSITSNDHRVHAELLRALATSRGSLDAPPLATASVLTSGSAAVPALETYHESDLQHGWGAADFAKAAVEHLRQAEGVDSSLPRPRAETAYTFRELLRVGRLIQAAL